MQYIHFECITDITHTCSLKTPHNPCVSNVKEFEKMVLQTYCTLTNLSQEILNIFNEKFTRESCIINKKNLILNHTYKDKYGLFTAMYLNGSTKLLFFKANSGLNSCYSYRTLNDEQLLEMLIPGSLIIFYSSDDKLIQDVRSFISEKMNLELKEANVKEYKNTNEFSVHVIGNYSNIKPAVNRAKSQI